MKPFRSPPALAALLLGALFVAGATECTYRNRDFGSRTPDQLAQGTVAGFGGLRVGGVEYTTARLDVTLDGAVVTEADLRPGMVVALVGRLDSGGTTGRADTLVADAALVGTVSAVDPQADTLTVLGQRVRLGADTSIGTGVDGVSANAFAVGDRVAIHGYGDSSTGLVATRIDRAPATRALQAAGRVTALDAARRVLQVRGTTVDYADAGGIDANLAVGRTVVATGTAVNSDGSLRATRLEVRGDRAPGERDDGEIEGLVTRFASATDFTLGGRTITTDGSTAYANGAATDLGTDDRVVVTGRYDANGRLVARRIAFARDARFRVLAPVESFEPGGVAFAAGGFRVATDARTRWEDRSAIASRTFRYSELRTGDWVEVRGVEASAARTADALVVERRGVPPGFRIEFEAPVDSVANPNLTVAGVVVATANAEFRDRAGALLTRGQFFGQAAGAVVRARGAYSGATFVADAVALRP